MTKPSEIKVTPAATEELADIIVEKAAKLGAKPSTVTVAKKQRKSEPVRNPAFREHEGLRALQKRLNSRPAPRKSKK